MTQLCSWPGRSPVSPASTHDACQYEIFAMIDLLINPTVGVVVLEAGESLQRGRGVVLFKMSNGCSHLSAKFLDSRQRSTEGSRAAQRPVAWNGRTPRLGVGARHPLFGAWHRSLYISTA